MIKKKQLIIVTILCALVSSFWYFDISQYLNLESIKANQDYLYQQYQAAPLLFISVSCVAFVLYSALPLPGLILFTLLFSSIFGFWGGFLITSFGAAIGGSIAFYTARYLLREHLQQHFPLQYSLVNKGVEKDGGFYLFSIRIVPIFPFFLINWLMGLTTLRGSHFYIATQTGMLASTAVFANAGTHLSKVDSIQNLFSPHIIASFALIAALPLAGKWFIKQLGTAAETS